MARQAHELGRVDALIVSALLSISCATADTPRTPPAAHEHGDVASGAPPSQVSATGSAEAAAPAPLPIEEALIDLPVEGFEPSLVVTPATAKKAPLVVVAHGAGGSPGPHCERYRALVKGRGFILCTRGRPLNKQLPPEERGYFYDGHFELGKEVRLALASMRARFGDRVDLDGILYAGFSQGATMGILYLQQGGATEAHVSRILLVEGGSGEWTIGLASKLKKEGVGKVGIVCGQTSCRRAANRSERYIAQGGLGVTSLYAQGAGHTYGGPVAELVDRAWQWLVEDDPRWTAPP